MITKFSSRRKSQTALALAVSIWIATGGVASATDTVINEDYDGIVLGNYDNVSNNTVTVNNAAVRYDIYGSQSWEQTGEVKNNTVTLNGAVVGDSVYGAFSCYTAVTDNRVTVNGSTVGDSVYGGESLHADATGNTVTLNGAVVGGDVFGGYVKAGSSQVTAKGNTVTVTDSVIKWKNSDYTPSVCGGYIGAEVGKGDAIDNTVTLKNTTGNYNVYGGYTGFGTAAQNTVRLIHLNVAGAVYGGWTYNGGGAAGNTVTLKDTTVTGGVFGGYRERPGSVGSVVSGNTLNLFGANRVSSGVHNFETINIRHARWGTPTLTTNEITNHSINPSEPSKPIINAEGIIFTGAPKLEGIVRTTLIQGPMAGYTGTITGKRFRIGTTLEGRGKLSVDGDDLIFTVARKPNPDGSDSDELDIEVQEQTHNALMGAGAGMATLSAGNDFIGAATEGLGQAANVGSDGVSSYAQMGGGSIRQETGSHIDVKSWNAVLALGRKNEKPRGTFEYGAFFEYGRGNYTTHNGDLRGDGFTYYTGGGLLAKYTAKGGAYVEGSLRAGSVHGETQSIMLDENDEPYNCELDAPYLGAHIGVGKEIALKSGDSVDVYGKYFLNRRNSTSFDFGGQYELDALTSKVLRVGARYTIKRGGKWNYYAGAAYEHEFDGKATGTADGFAIRGTDPSGGSVRMELGATMEPDAKSPWKLDLNLSGFAGKKRGMTGGVSVAFMF